MDNDDDNADTSDISVESVKEELTLESSIDSDAEHVQLDRSDERFGTNQDEGESSHPIS